MLFRKFWDAYSGIALHSFPHNHIVRSVALSPSSDRLLTGGQEKKVRIFDLGKSDAAPDFLGGDASTTCHEGTIRSVVWVSDTMVVTAGEDGFVKCVGFNYVSLTIYASICTMRQVVGFAHTADGHELEIPNEHHVDGAFAADEAYRAHIWAHGRVHPRDAVVRAFA